ncbi:MAG: STAS domain-containing protein [Planctomycetaceae bacterium]|nr:STAS domain-containing protein [Planctomycetaceae bacterium]
MGIQNWSDEVTVVELNDDPQFSEDLSSLMDNLEGTPNDVVLNFTAVGFINSSNVAKLLRLRKMMMSSQRRLILCGINTHVWGVFLVTGLDKIYEVANDISTALAIVQLGNAGKEQ